MNRRPSPSTIGDFGRDPSSGSLTVTGACGCSWPVEDSVKLEQVLNGSATALIVAPGVALLSSPLRLLMLVT